MPRPPKAPQIVLEQVRETRARADHWELRTAQLRGELIERSDLEQALQQVFVAINQIIIGSNLTEREKMDMQRNISTVPMRIREIVHKQRKKAGSSEEKGTNGNSGE